MVLPEEQRLVSPARTRVHAHAPDLTSMPPPTRSCTHLPLPLFDGLAVELVVATRHRRLRDWCGPINVIAGVHRLVLTRVQMRLCTQRVVVCEYELMMPSTTRDESFQTGARPTEHEYRLSRCLYLKGVLVPCREFSHTLLVGNITVDPKAVCTGLG